MTRGVSSAVLKTFRGSTEYVSLKRAPRLPGRAFSSALPRLSTSFDAIKQPNSSTLNGVTRDPTELTRVTTLQNGVRVATEALPGHFSGIGVYLDAGARYENDGLRGVSHFMDRLAFKSTKSKTELQMREALELLGGNTMCSSSRDFLFYQGAVFNKDIGTMLGLLAETVREPLLTDQELLDVRETVWYEVGEIWKRPDAILPELLHAASYHNNTLGNPVLCPEERIEQITPDTIREYREIFVQPERIVVAFAGVEHEKAVQLVEQYFGDMQSPHQSPSPSTTINPKMTSHIVATPSNGSVYRSMSTHASSASVTDSAAHWTGETLIVDLPDLVDGKPPEHTYLYIGFESVPITSPDIYAMATLQVLLGGGSSFSAGGPGKGMYSRLYTNVLNRYGWVEQCLGFNHAYTDSGIFGIAAAVRHDAAHAISDVVCKELALLTHDGKGGITHAEADRAKNQLRSSLLMNLESRMVELEDLGRQVQTQGYKTSVKEMVEKIDRLTTKDLRLMAETILSGNVKNKGQGTGRPAVVIMRPSEIGKPGNSATPVGDVTDTASRFGLGRGSNVNVTQKSSKRWI